MTAIRQRIFQGPSKFDLMLALFDRDAAGPREVLFKLVEDNSEAYVVVTGLEIEDGSGNCWLFKGYLESYLPPNRRRKNSILKSPCSGFYRTDTRKGWIEVIVA